jgi:ribonuclease E
VGKKTRVRIERVLDGTAYATLVDAPARAQEPITAEGEAEKPTRAPRAKKEAEVVLDEVAEVETEPAEVEKPAEAVAEEPAAGEEEPPKKKTRRGTRGGRGRKRKTPAAADEATVAGNGAGEPEHVPAPVIHLPEPDLGREPEELVAEPVEAEAAPNGDEPAKPKKKTRRGTRGGRNRRKRPAPESVAIAEPGADGADEETEGDDTSGWDYVPMSEWEDELSDS